MTLERLPPGTQRIEDKAGENILLAPQPNADPNQPLVPCALYFFESRPLTNRTELDRIPQDSAYDHSLLLCVDGLRYVSSRLLFAFQ